MIVPTLQLGYINSQKKLSCLISENFALEHFPLHWIQLLDTSTILYLYMYEWIWKELFWMENITRVFCIVLYCFFGFLVVAEMPKTSRFRAIKGLPRCYCKLHWEWTVHARKGVCNAFHTSFRSMGKCLETIENSNLWSCIL